jgi:phosphate-selective porin
MGYSFQYSKPNPDGFPTMYAFLQAVDFHFKPLVKQVSGQFDLATEWIWSEVSSATYDPTGLLGFGPVTFNNHRQGGYVSLTYRPTEVENKYLRNTEFCLRYDSLQSATTSPGGEHESRWTLGVDYWLTSYCVIKTAYEIDNKKVGPDQNAFILQVGYGL